MNCRDEEKNMEHSDNVANIKIPTGEDWRHYDLTDDQNEGGYGIFLVKKNFSSALYRHEEMFIECITVGDALPCLLKSLVTYQQVGDEIDEQQLPCGKIEVMFYPYGGNQKDDSNSYGYELVPQSSLMMTVLVMGMTLFFVMMLM